MPDKGGLDTGGSVFVLLGSNIFALGLESKLAAPPIGPPTKNPAANALINLVPTSGLLISNCPVLASIKLSCATSVVPSNAPPTPNPFNALDVLPPWSVPSSNVLFILFGLTLNILAAKRNSGSISIAA